MHLMTVVGTRPEIIRLASLIKLLDANCRHTLVHTGQNYDPELKDVFFSDLGLRDPDFYLGVSTETLGSVIGQTIIEIEKLLVNLRPDGLLVLGDTNSALSAIVAKRLGIPVYHMEAGNRSYDENVPEETNRRIVDHVADFNLPYSEHAMRNLLREGIHPRTICVTGSPLTEVISSHLEQINASKILDDLHLKSGEYILVSAHRQENVDHPARLKQLFESLESIGKEFDKTVLVSLHPRTRERLKKIGMSETYNLRFNKPFGFIDYMRLQQEAFCVLSDSGSISEESSFLGFPAVTIRDSMERPEALDSGSIVMSGLDADNMRLAILEVTRLPKTKRVQLQPLDYSASDFSLRVFRFIISTLGRHTFWSGIRKSEI